MIEDFDGWYAELRPVSRALVAWCGDPRCAEALDEAFVRAIERWDRVRVMDEPTGWLWRTATNVARRRMRRQGLEGRPSDVIRREPLGGCGSDR
jgi:RNA polymerase sigma-70 factor (ECF subfamily)